MNAACGRISKRTRYKPVAVVLLAAWLGIWNVSAHAVTCTSSGGSWNVFLTWGLTGCGLLGIPSLDDDVIIANGGLLGADAVVTVNISDAVARSVTIRGGNYVSTLQFNSGTSLAVDNNITIEAPTSTRNKTIAVNNGNLTVGGNLTIIGASASTSVSRLTVTSGSVTIGTPATTGNVTLTGGTTSTRDALLTVGTGLITIYGGLTINQNGAAGAATASITSTGIITVNGAVSNGDTVDIGPGIFNANAAFTSSSKVTATTGTLNIGGDAIVSDTFTYGTGTVVFNGASNQTVSGNALGFYNVTMNNSNGGITLGNNLTVNGMLTFTSGKIITGLNKVIVETNGSATRVNDTDGYVAGDLKKLFPSDNPPSFTFYIGDVDTYASAPVTVSVKSAIAPYDLTLSTTKGDHPNISTSSFDPDFTVNRYWTIAGSSITGTYDATFKFPRGDIDLGAVPANFEVQQYIGTSWSPLATVDARTGTSTKVSGLNAAGNFAIGELKPKVKNEFIYLREVY